jgi:hypothetical protein
MRKDMAKVIVERPRIKPWSAGKRGRVKLEDLPQKIGLRRMARLGGGWKCLNENLAPLRRYLFKQVGRPWNKVYAEISANLRFDNAVQRHVHHHLKDFIVIKPRRYVDPRSDYKGLWHQPLYVDPVTGLLCRTDRLPEEKALQRARGEDRRAMQKSTAGL